MSACRGCGGTGIDASVSPRRAQSQEVPILMRRTSGVIEAGGTSNVFRGELAAEVAQRRMYFAGPLQQLAAHVAHRLKDGYEIVAGDEPDPSLACRWCNGYGSPEGQLTVRALQELAQT